MDFLKFVEVDFYPFFIKFLKFYVLNVGNEIFFEVEQYKIMPFHLDIFARFCNDETLMLKFPMKISNFIVKFSQSLALHNFLISPPYFAETISRNFVFFSTSPPQLKLLLVSSLKKLQNSSAFLPQFPNQFRNLCCIVSKTFSGHNCYSKVVKLHKFPVPLKI